MKTYPGRCYNCNELADVVDDYDADQYNPPALCLPCYRSAGRQAAIEAAEEAYEEERRERYRTEE